MGLGPLKNGRHQPITPYVGSWAATTIKYSVSADAFTACQQILAAEGLDTLVRDAARECIDRYRKGLGVDQAVAQVLADYAGRQGQQNRWGQ
jgi:hypothetical protein